jgi:hypothetical protein
MLVDTLNRRAQLFVKDLPRSDSQYEVVVVNTDGVVTRTLLTFSVQQAGTKQHDLENINLEGVASIAIRRVGETQPILVATIA